MVGVRCTGDRVPQGRPHPPRPDRFHIVRRFTTGAHRRAPRHPTPSGAPPVSDPEVSEPVRSHHRPNRAHPTETAHLQRLLDRALLAQDPAWNPSPSSVGLYPAQDSC